MNYKIISFDQNTGSIVVRYRDDMPPVNVDVPLNDDGLFITGQELTEYINSFIPVWHLERMDRLSAGVANADQIQSLVQEEIVPAVQEEPLLNPLEVENIKMWEQYELEKQIGNVLVKFGLVASNPAVIPVSEA